MEFPSHEEFNRPDPHQCMHGTKGGSRLFAIGQASGCLTLCDDGHVDQIQGATHKCPWHEEMFLHAKALSMSKECNPFHSFTVHLETQSIVFCVCRG